MGYLVNSSFAGAQSSLFSMSGWVRLQTASQSTALIWAGRCSRGVSPDNPPENGNHHPAIRTNFGGSTQGISCIFNSMFPDYSYGGGDYYVAMHTVGGFAPNAWHHFLLGANLAGVSSRNYEGTSIVCGKIIKVVIDGVNQTAHEEGPGSGMFPNRTDGRFFGEPNTYEYGVPGITLDTVTNDPDFPASFGYSTDKADFAYIQAWMGTYIDPTNAANFANFVRIVRGKGYPQDPARAVAAYGAPKIYFRGKASNGAFFINRGNGGAFIKTGTINDFLPMPSYG